MVFRNKSVNAHDLSMVPRADVPRSAFKMQHTLKSTFDAGYLIPIYVDEVLPGDSFNVSLTAYARMAVPLFPIMDNLHMETFFFFVPNRIVWTNWVKLMGEQDNPADSISYVVPQIVSKAAGYDVASLYDYLGLPTAGTPVITGTFSHSALPLRAHNMIYNEWFRDENLINSKTENKGDGPDLYTDYALYRRGKRHDYFAGALPWPVKGGVQITLPLGTSAPVKGLSVSGANAATAATTYETGGGSVALGTRVWAGGSLVAVTDVINSAGTAGTGGHFPNVYADLTAATAATVNQLRQSIQIQRLLERDARGGTRYVEKIRSHFNVVMPDYTAQRPVYLGGSSANVNVRAIPQTSATGLTGSTTPQGQLTGQADVVSRSGFTSSFTEHGHILGYVQVRADITYQQGLRKMWSRSTQYDHYFPVFSHLGEQAVLNKEIYLDGSANDALVFGYQERWAELRYFPSQITGKFRSTASGTIDAWHLAQKFTALPTLNETFINDTPPVSRVVAVGAAADGQQFIFDAFFDAKVTRPLPMYSVPGLMDHF